MPADDGGSPVTQYTATAWPGGQTCTVQAKRTCSIRGLANATNYTVTVTASNRVGTSERSPGAIVMTTGARLPSQKGGPARAKLMRVTASRGKVAVRWSAAGVHRVALSWQHLDSGKKNSQVVAPSGQMVLRGALRGRRQEGRGAEDVPNPLSQAHQVVSWFSTTPAIRSTVSS